MDIRMSLSPEVTYDAMRKSSQSELTESLKNDLN